MLAWSLSCYPQAILNIRRGSTVGTNPSLPLINTLGFGAYFTSNAAMFFSPLIRAQYAARNPASPVPTVRANDVAFAGHALIMCFVLLTMFSKPIWGFEQGAVGNGSRIGKGIIGVMLGCILGVAWMVGLVLVKGRDGGRDPDRFAWIDVVSFAASVWFKLSEYERCGIARRRRQIGRPRYEDVKPSSHYTRPYRHIYGEYGRSGRMVILLTDIFQKIQVYAIGLVKLAITMVKYIPQVVTNYQRQSTVGWSIEQILIDVWGGVLSVAQLIIDSSLQADWSGLTNNSVKLGLGILSIFFDIVRFHFLSSPL